MCLGLRSKSRSSLTKISLYVSKENNIFKSILIDNNNKTFHLEIAMNATQTLQSLSWHYVSEIREKKHISKFQTNDSGFRNIPIPD